MGSHFWGSGPVSGQLAPQTLLPPLGLHQGRACSVDPAPFAKPGASSLVWGAAGRFTTCAFLLATGQIICLPQNNIPVVVRERVGAGWARTSIPVVVGSRTEDLLIFEQGRGEAGTLNRYCACSVAHTITKEGTAPPPSPAELAWGLLTPLNEPLSACPGDLRLRKKEQGKVFGFKRDFKRSRQPVCGLDAGLCTGGEEMESCVLQVS